MQATCHWHGKHLPLLFLNLLLLQLVTLCTSRAAPPTGSFEDGSML
jgi:hypothetical protein